MFHACSWRTDVATAGGLGAKSWQEDVGVLDRGPNDTVSRSSRPRLRYRTVSYALRRFVHT